MVNHPNRNKIVAYTEGKLSECVQYRHRIGIALVKEGFSGHDHLFGLARAQVDITVADRVFPTAVALREAVESEMAKRGFGSEVHVSIEPDGFRRTA